MNWKQFCFWILVMNTFFQIPSFGDSTTNSSFDDRTIPLSDQSINEYQAYPFHRLFLISAIRSYQIYISPTKGGFCPMHPHCSLYGITAFRTYNPLKAFIMTSDRLHRCGHDLNNYETVEINGFVRFNDPVSFSFIENGFKSQYTRPPLAQNLILTIANIEGENQFIHSTKIISDDETRLFNFAEKLKSEEEYARAITEYRRLLSYFPETIYLTNASEAIFNCYYNSNQYLKAVHWGLELLTKKYFDEGQMAELKFGIGACYFKLGNFPLATTYLSKEMPEPIPEIIREKSILLQGLIYTHQVKWNKAIQCFSEIGKNSKYYLNAELCKEIALKGQKAKLKNPAVSGLLGIVPGLGYLYCGYKQTAFSAFIVNSLFIWSTIEAFRKNNKSLGTMLTVLSFGWYSGNIYGSVITAQRKNYNMNNDLLQKLEVGFTF